MRRASRLAGWGGVVAGIVAGYALLQQAWVLAQVAGHDVMGESNCPETAAHLHHWLEEREIP